MSKADQQKAQSGDTALASQVQTQTAPQEATNTTAEGNAQTQANNDYTQTQGNIANESANANSMASTGGFTPAQEEQYMNQATSGTANTFDVLGQQAAENATRTGAASGPAAIAQIARQGGQAQAQNENNAAVGLNTQVNANKNTGIGEQQNVTADTSNLFNTDTNQVTAQGAQLLSALGLQYSTQAQAQQMLSTLASQTKGPLDNILAVAGAAGGVAKAFTPLINGPSSGSGSGSGS